MRLVTWNVNSLKARLPRVEEWIDAHAPDLLLLQETKCTDEAFPTEVFSRLGYESAHHGDGRWNGVAIVSRVGLAGVRAGFVAGSSEISQERRILSADCGGVRVYSVYVPNGRAVGSEFYAAKLEWLANLRRELDMTCDPGDAVAVGGDFNVAPEDRDVWDITQFTGLTHVTEPERDALRQVMDFGLEDVVRRLNPDVAGLFSWWDYRGGAFHKGEGMRIDLVLGSASLAARVRAAFIDREARKGQGSERQPSDHAPVIVDLTP
ncbi:MAG TPA: exodeoxyribonuclease III [Acidimicrobiales bacterium]|nr:exodeoxyribonuclease III [Acidimicrobiales bacterium]